MELLKKNKSIFWVLGYGIFYLISFFLLEKSDVQVHLIHSFLDDRIPFCEYFIIPYMLWFVFFTASIIYFAFCCKDIKEYYQLIISLGIGATLFLIISYIYPNGHNLRPELIGDGFFIDAVRLLYSVDTPTNILPSLHVFISVACCIAILKNKECKKKKLVTVSTVILTISIVASTLFLKQHSVYDVILALELNWILYMIIYKLIPMKEKELRQLLVPEQLFTVPNLLSVFRFVLAIFYMGIFQRYGMDGYRPLLIGILAVSGITDFLDGYIARHFNMVSEVGKLIDPLADKVTQGVLLICFLESYSMAKYVFILFVIKEIYMFFAGARTISETKNNDGASWYGKVSTAFFYVVMVLLLSFPNIQESVANMLICACGVFMFLALILYAREFRIKRSRAKRKHKTRYFQV